MGYKVAIAGATGNVGREMLAILAERNFPADQVVALLCGDTNIVHGVQRFVQPRSVVDFFGLEAAAAS